MKRDQRIGVNLNHDERELLEQIASASGLRLGEFLRTSAMSVPYQMARLHRAAREALAQFYAIRSETNPNAVRILAETYQCADSVSHRWSFLIV
ncbi:hypothetical protein LCGC14_2259490 [marine sediment metagenome]|uniref:Uncharacterized protein n=1 Tax=marine sediment metagenome TaxID=412755 RepID=A0A0F9FV49_9ZZZZ